MPSVSKPQHNLMEASAHGAVWATKKVPSKVAKEYVIADADKKFKARAKKKEKK